MGRTGRSPADVEVLQANTWQSGRRASQCSSSGVCWDGYVFMSRGLGLEVEVSGMAGWRCTVVDGRFRVSRGRNGVYSQHVPRVFLFWLRAICIEMVKGVLSAGQDSSVRVCWFINGCVPGLPGVYIEVS